MDRKLLTASTLAFLAGAGGVYVMDRGSAVQVEIVADAPPAGSVEITGRAVAPLADAMAAAGSPGGVDCIKGYISNHPDEWYCERGTAGFLVLDRAAVTALENQAKDGTVLLMLDEGGKLYAEPAQ